MRSKLATEEEAARSKLAREGEAARSKLAAGAVLGHLVAVEPEPVERPKGVMGVR